MSARGVRPPTLTFASGAARVFELSLGDLLWSKRTVFLALVAGAPVFVALMARLLQGAGIEPLRINSAPVGGSGIFGMMIWVFYLRFIVPILGVFYGTALIADEVEDRTVTYLFTRPIRRGAVLVGKYLAYLVCTSLIVLPSVMLVFFLVIPVAQIGSAFGALAADLGLLALGLAAYGALFALAGAALGRPLLSGLVFVLGWEQVALLVPGYLKRLTIAHYMQALVPHAMPSIGVVSAIQSVMTDNPPALVCILVLAVVVVGALRLGVLAVETREYVLDQ